jgi:spermidine/putrescine ABC transporter ATP-binding subunit
MSNIVQLRNLTKTYPGNVTAVDDLSLEVKKGEFITFLGPSGCGKTTTLRMLAGFEEPDNGQILLNGEDITATPAYQRNINTVFQDYALFPHLTILENVMYGLKRSGLPKDECTTRAMDSLEKVELAIKAPQLPGTLSGGQKQRVALARALVCNPSVLLLDEPLSALDAKLREAMQVELKHLHETLGLTFILVTHDQTEAMVMSDRVVIMEAGKIVQIGHPTDLYERPANAYVANFIGTSNFIDGTVVDSSGSHVSIDINGTPLEAGSSDKTFRKGQNVKVSVRPEKMSVTREHKEGSSARASLGGELVDSYFHGSYMRYEVKIENGQRLLIDRQLENNLKEDVLLTVGERVCVGFNADNAIIFE